MNTNKHAKEFRDQGYTRVPKFFNEEQMAELIELIKDSDPKANHESALNNGNLRFYSNIFFRSQKLQQFLAQQRIVDFLKGIIGPDFWIRWDQAVFKGPGAPAFAWHQDNGYNKLKNEHFQFWIALSKMTEERGGLWLVPGSHKGGVLPHSMVDNHMAYQGSTEGAICVEAEVGDVVLFSSLTLHYTSPNVSQHDRWAYVVEYMDSDHYDPYIDPPYFIVAEDGKPQPKFVQNYRGSLNPVNRLKYAGPRLRNVAGRLKKVVRGK